MDEDYRIKDFPIHDRHDRQYNDREDKLGQYWRAILKFLCKLREWSVKKIRKYSRSSSLPHSSGKATRRGLQRHCAKLTSK